MPHLSKKHFKNKNCQADTSQLPLSQLITLTITTTTTTTTMTTTTTDLSDMHFKPHQSTARVYETSISTYHTNYY